MKIVTALEMAELEKTAYDQGYSGRQFMMNAGAGIAHEIIRFISENKLKKKVYLLCGKGNNTGDGFVACSELLLQGYRVEAVQFDPPESCSSICQEQRQRFLDSGGILHSSIPIFAEGIILDGLFGTGFKGTVSEPYSSIIEAANRSKLPILAIDVPSGLNGSTGVGLGSVIEATETLFLGLPKLGFFLNEGWNTVGELKRIDFGLPKLFVEACPDRFHLLVKETVSTFIPPMHRNRHKYEAGVVAALAGSPQMPGSSLLATTSAFRGGCGLVRLYHPEGMEPQLSNSPYELIKIPYKQGDSEFLIKEINKAQAAFVGPGLGRTQELQNLLKTVLPKLTIPLVIDADALPFSKGIKRAILTPHHGEMQHLLESETKLVLNEETLKRCQAFTDERECILVLKGGPTFIFQKDSPVYVSTTGNPGMATAGTGDVLTGLIASLLSQGIAKFEAACLGVYLHGLAGDVAAVRLGGERGLMASDLLDCLLEAAAIIEKK